MALILSVSVSPHTLHVLFLLPDEVHVALFVVDQSPYECPLAHGSTVSPPPPSPASTAAALTIE